MHMIGQDDPCVDVDWMIGAYRLNHLAQDVDIFADEDFLAAICHHGKKIGGAFGAGSAIIGHRARLKIFLFAHKPFDTEADLRWAVPTLQKL